MRNASTSSLDIVMAISAMEGRLRQAMLTGDVAELDKLIADDLVFSTHLGQLLTKEADLEAYRSGRMKVREHQLSETDIRPMGELVLVVTRCHLVGTYAGHDFVGDFRISRLWRRKGEQWEIAAGHSSAIV